MLIGIDVGGTNTDAVLMEGVNLVARAQVPHNCRRNLGHPGGPGRAARQKPPAASVTGVMLGTTHFITPPGRT